MQKALEDDAWRCMFCLSGEKHDDNHWQAGLCFLVDAQGESCNHVMHKTCARSLVRQQDAQRREQKRKYRVLKREIGNVRI